MSSSINLNHKDGENVWFLPQRNVSKHRGDELQERLRMLEGCGSSVHRVFDDDELGRTEESRDQSHGEQP